MNEKLFEKDKVSVVIPVYNEERFLRQALESVVKQVDCVILGDNASTDGTENICREFAERYPHIVYFRNEENLGNLENFQRCFTRVQTEFFFHLGGHDTVPSSYVFSLKKKLQETPEALGAYTDRYDVELDGTMNVSRSLLCKKTVDDKGRTWPEYSMLPSPMERQVNVICATTHDNYWSALYRSETTLPIWRMMNHEYTFQAILGIARCGKMVYCDDTIYYRRNVHTDDSLQTFQKRLLGDKYMHLPIYLSDSHWQNAEFGWTDRAKIRLNLFINTADPFLSDDEKKDLFCKYYRKLKQIHGFTTVVLDWNLPENLFLAESMRQMDRQAAHATLAPESMSAKPKGFAKIWREIKRPFLKYRRRMVKSIREIDDLSPIYRLKIPREGVQYLGNDEYGPVSVTARMENGVWEYPDMIVTNQSIGRHFIHDAKKIVNIGSGVGTFEKNNAVEHRETLFVASEFDASSVEFCKQHRSASNVVFCSDNIETLCQTYGQFDLAVCIDVIEHIKNYGGFLQEFVKLAERAVIATPNRDRGHLGMTDLQTPPYKYHTHEFNAGELYFLLKAFYKKVELYSFPDPCQHELIPVGIYSSYGKLVAHCHNE